MKAVLRVGMRHTKTPQSPCQPYFHVLHAVITNEALETESRRYKHYI
jgi:hypothetical protein